MTILVPIDGSPESTAGLRAAAQAAQAARASDGTAEAIVIAAIGELPETSTHEQETRRQLTARLNDAAAAIPGLQTRQRVELAGDPVRGILDIAREEHADRIVLASPERGMFADLAHRSVSEEVSEEAPIPVTIVDVEERD